MTRVVLDTTVLVAAVISPTGPSAQILELVTNRKIRPYVTDTVIEEYDRVFNYKHLQHLDRRRIARLREALKVAATKVKSRGRMKLSEHESDNRIYECAVAAKAHYITFFGGVRKTTCVTSAIGTLVNAVGPAEVAVVHVVLNLVSRENPTSERC